jgi:hypothetical protein
LHIVSREKIEGFCPEERLEILVQLIRLFLSVALGDTTPLDNSGE